MSSSVSIYAVKPPDAQWLAQKAVWEACEAAGVEPPAATVEFFDDCDPDPDGVATRLGSIEYPEHAALQGTNRGVNIILKDLPTGTKIVRVVWL